MFVGLGPLPPYGRQTYTGSSGKDTFGAGTFWGVLNFSLRASSTQLGLDLTGFVIRHPSLETGWKKVNRKRKPVEKIEKNGNN